MVESSTERNDFAQTGRRAVSGDESGGVNKGEEE